MPQEARAVVAVKKGAPVEVVPVLVPEPGPGEVLVGVQACGVCHTDLHYRDGAIGDEFPYLLGHEAAGMVEAVGPGVTALAPVTMWSWPGGRRAAAAAPAAGAARGTASTAAMPPSRSP
ncbi:hypothetical protein SVIO_019100 [Streptomyces violaceusniger]|uniref:alcohol dehydrogenase n=1 Tax=Streptomyces violaceusniger TaxID=68280 RepID=A0A4D4KXM8_STRVO|nr:hypothetical protein SVIO_019100 [Streptomyces violaceusniger]